MVNELYLKQQIIDSIKDSLYDVLSSQSDEDELYIVDVSEIAIPLADLLLRIIEAAAIDVIASLICDFIKHTKKAFYKEKITISTKQIKLLMIAAISAYKSNKKKDILKIVDEVFNKFSDIND